MNLDEARTLIDRIEAELPALRAALGFDGQPTAGAQPPEAFTAGPFAIERGEETGWQYYWPKNDTPDRYVSFQRYRDPNGRTLAIGKAEPVDFYGRRRLYAVVHEVSRGDQLNALVVFASADDYEDSKELLALIKGKGPGGRRMFRPGERPPEVYVHAKVETFPSRITGPYTRNGLAVVCKADDYVGMLTHAVLQKRLRGR